MNGACSQLLEVRADILIRSVLHPEPAGDRAELREAEALVKVAGVGVAFDDGVKLKDAEAELFCLGEAVEDELFADVAAAGGGCDGVAGVADVAAAADVVGVEDVEAVDDAVLLGDARVALGREKVSACCQVERLFLREGDAVFDDFVPDFDDLGEISGGVFAYNHGNLRVVVQLYNSRAVKCSI